MQPKVIASIVGAGVLGLAALGVAKSDDAKSASAKSTTAKADVAEHMKGGPRPLPSGSSAARHPAADWAEGFRKKRPNPKEVEARIAEVKATVASRRAQHLAELKGRFGAQVLATREFAQEFRIHARRMAFIHRAQFIATTEFDEPRRSKALARIDKLMEREQARHERHLEKLKSGQAAGVPSGAPSAVASAAPAPSGSSK